MVGGRCECCHHILAIGVARSCPLDQLITRPLAATDAYSSPIPWGVWGQQYVDHMRRCVAPLLLPLVRACSVLIFRHRLAVGSYRRVRSRAPMRAPPERGGGGQHHYGAPVALQSIIMIHVVPTKIGRVYLCQFVSADSGLVGLM